MCSRTGMGCFGEEKMSCLYRDMKFGSSSSPTLLTIPIALLRLLICYGTSEKFDSIKIYKGNFFFEIIYF
jgi:hypothetical protein